MRFANRLAVLGSLMSAVAVIVPAGSAEAQANPIAFGVTGGATFPTGDFGDGVDTGFHGGVLLQWSGSGIPFGIRADVLYHRFSITDVSDANVNILGGTVNGVFEFPMNQGAPVTPYLIGGVGFYRASLDCSGCEDIDSENKFGINGGGGLRFPMTGFSGFVEARYHNIFTEDENTAIIPISVGFMIHR